MTVFPHLVQFSPQPENMESFQKFCSKGHINKGHANTTEVKADYWYHNSKSKM